MRKTESERVQAYADRYYSRTKGRRLAKKGWNLRRWQLV